MTNLNLTNKRIIMELNIKKLNVALAENEMTKPELAFEIDMTPANLYSIIKNKSARLEVLTKIGEALDIDPKDLLT